MQTRSVVSDDDLTLDASSDQPGHVGDIVFKAGGVERGRIKSDAPGTGVLGTPAFFLGSTNPGVTNFSQQLAGIDTANGQMLWISSTAGQQLLTSANLGVSFSADRTLPAGNWYEKKKIVAFKGKLYLLALTSAASGIGAVWQTTPDYTPGATWTWTNVLTLASTDNIPTNLSTDGTYLYVGEYGDPVGGPSIWRSSDGTTWAKVTTQANNRHNHAVEPDPYNPGHVWATWGDANANSVYVTRSTDYGATWTTILNTTNYGTYVQAVQISFTQDYVWFCGDDVGCCAYRMSRTELLPRQLSINRHTDIPVPSAIVRSGGQTFADGVFTSGSKTFTSATAAFVAGDVGRTVVGANITGGLCYIDTVTNGTTAVMSIAATKTGTATFYLSGSVWSPNNAYFGLVDPATEMFYIASWNPTIMDDSTRGALFLIPRAGYNCELLSPLPPVNSLQRWGSFIYGGYFWAGRWRVPLLTRP